jgi:hypothetical protein
MVLWQAGERAIGTEAGDREIRWRGAIGDRRNDAR